MRECSYSARETDPRDKCRRLEWENVSIHSKRLAWACALVR